MGPTKRITWPSTLDNMIKELISRFPLVVAFGKYWLVSYIKEICLQSSAKLVSQRDSHDKGKNPLIFINLQNSCLMACNVIKYIGKGNPRLLRLLAELGLFNRI